MDLLGFGSSKHIKWGFLESKAFINTTADGYTQKENNACSAASTYKYKENNACTT